MASSAARGRREHMVSAGGVVYRRGRRGIGIVLCGRMRDGLWALPKGSWEAGEMLERAAARGVEEETGLRVAIQESVGSIGCQFTGPDGTRYDKKVAHHLMVPTGGSLARHDEEFDAVRWFAAEEALRHLRYPNERDIVRRAVRLIGERETQ